MQGGVPEIMFVGRFCFRGLLVPSLFLGTHGRADSMRLFKKLAGTRPACRCGRGTHPLAGLVQPLWILR